MKTSCVIIISHFESLPFLRAAIRQIRKYAVPEISQHIIIAEQSCKRTYSQVKEEYGNDEDITISWMRALYSGFGIDHIIRNEEINTDYIVQLHSDSFPISFSWLRLSITLIEEYNLSFVGQLQFIASGKDSIYPPNPFFAMAQCFNVARTETYRELSMVAGFTRFHNRPQAGMTWLSNDWGEWAKEDYKARGSDDDVVAFHWEDKHRQHDKLGLAISGFIEPNYGRIIDDILFHFCSAREAIGVMSSMPELYQEYTKKINENYSDDLIDEMIALARANKPPEMEILTRNYWDGKLKVSSPPSNELNNRIEELKNVDR